MRYFFNALKISFYERKSMKTDTSRLSPIATSNTLVPRLPPFIEHEDDYRKRIVGKDKAYERGAITEHAHTTIKT
jgi:hypothetical protein